MSLHGIACVWLALLQAVSASDIPEYLSAAVANPGRAVTDRARDADRNPVEAIAFAGVKPGDRIADFLPGRGYFTQILCKVVGVAGRVYAVEVPRAATLASASAPQQLAAQQQGMCANVVPITLQSRNFPAPQFYNSSDDPGSVYEYYSPRSPAESFAVPEPLDLIWSVEGYQRLHDGSLGAQNLQWVNAALFKALKPGGILIIEEPAANAVERARHNGAELRRVDADQMKQEFIAAGFEFAGASHARHIVSNPSKDSQELQRESQRALFKFRKPAD